jgi:beta-glucosidase
MMDYNIRHGRTYMYMKDAPLYPFVYGLSYTKFRYASACPAVDTLPQDGEISCGVEIENTGSRSGDEVVELYVHHLGSKVERPLKELKGFERVTIPAGKTRTVHFSLKASALAYWDEARNRWSVEQEPVELLVGASAADIRLTKKIVVK